MLMDTLFKVLKVVGIIVIVGIIIFTIILWLRVPDAEDIVESYKQVGLVVEATETASTLSEVDIDLDTIVSELFSVRE